MPRVDPSDPIHHPQPALSARTSEYPEIVVDGSEEEDEAEAAAAHTALTEVKPSTTTALPEAKPGKSTDPTSSGETEACLPKPPPRSVPKAEEEDIPDID